MNVCAGTITSSRGPMPAACSMMVSAAVPDADADAVGHPAVRGELGLELLELLAEHERARGDYAVEGLSQVVDDWRMLSPRSTNGTAGMLVLPHLGVPFRAPPYQRRGAER